jgi:uncharacterized ferritin-like protein (DUF455 family)
VSSALRDALLASDPAEKVARVAALGETDLVAPAAMTMTDWTVVPGRPERPRLVAPREVPRRGLGSVGGRAALLHAVAHIEFNAINLALDAILRFPGMPPAYARDWLSVAQDEARHFQLLSSRLGELGHAYGDFPAHNGLWEAAEKTAHDVRVRMACVPRVLEARGLDVTPGMIERLRQAGDRATVAILETILREEVGHVAIGSRWYRWCCAQAGVDPDIDWPELLAAQGVALHPPFNRVARADAGFSAAELRSLGV